MALPELRQTLLHSSHGATATDHVPVTDGTVPTRKAVIKAQRKLTKACLGIIRHDCCVASARDPSHLGRVTPAAPAASTAIWR